MENEMRETITADYEPPTFCAAAVQIEVNGETQEYACSQRAGHAEDHSCRIYWANGDEG